CTRLNWTFLPTFPFIVAVSGLAGLLLALPMARVTGRYVTIVTLGFCEIVNIIMTNWESLTRGSMGIMNIARPTAFGYLFKSNKSYFYFVLFFVALVYILIQWTIDSKLGRNLKAIRDDSVAAAAMGIRLFPHKVTVFTMSAALAGLAGALYSHYIGYIDPSSFTSAESFICISIVVVGGLGNMIGSMIGALLLMALPEYLRDFDKYRMIVYGIVLVLIMWLNHSLIGARVKDAVSKKWRSFAGLFSTRKSLREAE
ncbi:MAG: branched-chain amino acid ABC transporter permease, partial [Clostridiales bacterium]|nr:branched-chain amino acid ABC transporter permease [Clostridiales bacterium]